MFKVIQFKKEGFLGSITNIGLEHNLSDDDLEEDDFAPNNSDNYIYLELSLSCDNNNEQDSEPLPQASLRLFIVKMTEDTLQLNNYYQVMIERDNNIYGDHDGEFTLTPTQKINRFNVLEAKEYVERGDDNEEIPETFYQLCDDATQHLIDKVMVWLESADFTVVAEEPPKSNKRKTKRGNKELEQTKGEKKSKN